MIVVRAPRKPGLVAEYLLALACVLAGLHMAWQTYEYGYFPQPFFYDTDDTWRDWFSVAIWAHEDGAYDSWGSIYPPLSFAFLKLVGLPQCYEYAPMATVRDCDWVGVVVMHTIYALNIVLTALTFLKIDRATALPRSLVISISMPMLFGLERGNLVLLCFTFVILGFGPLLASARMRWLCIALAVNLKVYLIASVVAQLLRRRWLAVEGIMVATIVVWIVSFLIYGAGTPFEVMDNIVNWATGSTPSDVLAVWYPNTYLPLKYVLAESSAPVNVLLGSSVVNAALIFIPAVTILGQGLIMLASVATWFRPEVVPLYRVSFFGAALAMITSETSTYTQPIVFFFVFMEPWKGWARPAALIVTYILCIPGDIMLSNAARVVSYSFIGQRYVIAEYSVALGMIIRPFLFMLPAYFLSVLTVKDVWSDVRNQGWSTRRRFKSDLPILPGIVRPSPLDGTH